MDLPHIARDEFLHYAEAQQQQHLEHVVHAATKLDVSANSSVPVSRGSNSTEHTPLLMQSPDGTHVVAVDLDKIEEILTAEEKEAIDEDAKLPVRAIVREEFIKLIKLSVPLVLTALLEFVPDTMLTMMGGYVSPSESAQILAAMNLSASLQVILFVCVVQGLASGIGTFCSQSFGGKRMVELWLYCQAGLIVYAICMPFIICAFLGGSHILKALGQDPVISDTAENFLLVNVPTIPLGVVYAVITSGLHAQNIVTPFVVATLAGWTVGCTAAYALSFHTSLGYLGIAAATPICSLVKILVLLPVVLHNKVFQESWPGWQPKAAMALLPKISKLGASSVLMTVFLNIGFAITSLLAGLLPNADVMITVNNILGITIQLSMLPLLGIVIGGAIRIGNALGAGKARRAALVSHIVVASAIGIASIEVVATMLIAKPLASAFTPDPAVIAASLDLTYKMVLIIPILGFSFGFQSILRACGKQLLVAKLNFVCMFAISSALGWIFATQFNGGLTGLWFGSLAGAALTAIYGAVWLRNVSWARLAHETKHNTHLGAETAGRAPADAF